MHHQENSIDVIGELPDNVVVHDLSFDWSGKRLAAACSDKTIKIYLKRSEGWVEEGCIKIPGASAWKVKWARPEFGIILATCSLDRNIRIYELKRVDKNEKVKNDWIAMPCIQENKAVEDIKFTPSKSIGLCLAVASSDGVLKVLMAEDPFKLHEWSSPFGLLVNELGLNCLSWSKNMVKQDECIIAVGCKSVQTSPRRILNGMKYSVSEQEKQLVNTNTVAFVNFNKAEEEKERQLEKISVPRIKEERAINDISWALMNGRSYYLLAIASDVFLKVFQLNVRDQGKDRLPVIDVNRQVKLSDNPSYRVSWNVMSTYLSVSEKKKIRVWRSYTRGVWTEIKEIEE